VLTRTAQFEVCVALARARHSASMAKRYVKGAMYAVVSSGLGLRDNVVAISGCWDWALEYRMSMLHYMPIGDPYQVSMVWIQEIRCIDMFCFVGDLDSIANGTLTLTCEASPTSLFRMWGTDHAKYRINVHTNYVFTIIANTILFISAPINI
jgi:hypothetical protein